MSKQNGMLVRATGQKKCKFLKSKMADRRHFKNRQIAISVKNYPISMKFGTLHQMLNPIAVT